jgi:DNA-binding MarR family transcriptional regulator
VAIIEPKKVNPDAIPGHFEILKIYHIAEWDVLAFLSQHGPTLASAEQIARLLGHSSITVGSALDLLAASGLVQRSRSSNGVRLYRFASSIASDSLRFSLRELMKVAKDRKGRLLFIRHLQQIAAEKDLRERCGLHLA